MSEPLGNRRKRLDNLLQNTVEEHNQQADELLGVLQRDFPRTYRLLDGPHFQLPTRREADYPHYRYAVLEDIKDPRRAHYIFKILLTGVQPAYQVAHPGEKDHTNVDRAAWISTFEEALAKAIVQIVLSRQAEQAFQAVGSPKE